MTSRRFNENKFPLNWLYVLLTHMLAEDEHEELRGEMRRCYWRLLEKKRHSRTNAILRTSWRGLMYVAGAHNDNIFFKSGSFKEEALKLKDFFSKLYGISCLLIFPVLYFAQGIQQTLFIFLLLALISWLCVSFEWTFNHKSALKFYSILTGFMMISPLLMITLIPEQRQIFYYYISTMGFTENLWLEGLSVFILLLSTFFIYYLIMWLVCGVTAYLIAGAWYSRSFFFK